MTMLSVLLVSCVLVWNISAVVACKGGGSEPAKVRSAEDETVLVMSGGLTRDPDRQVEAFFTTSNTSRSYCFLPDLPEDRNFNTLDFVNNQLILCGGDVMKSQRHGLSCLSLTPAGWVEVKPQGKGKVTLKERRFSHSSWASPEGLLLIGGAGSKLTTEFVPTEPEEDGRMGFPLTHPLQDACAITLEDSVITTGGFFSQVLVTMYNITGDSWELPTLNSGRWNHGCSWYVKGEDKVLIVAGGTGPDHSAMSSTEVLVLGQREWSFAADLPAHKEHLSSARVDNMVYMAGGESVYAPGMHDYEDRHSILLWEEEEEEQEVAGAWVEVGKMKIARNFHGMTAVDEEFVNKYCEA